jgi:hypothetical protein
MKKWPVLFLIVFSLSSCQLIDRIFKGDIVARVGKSVLYKSDINTLIPSNISPEDSANIINRYINSWATKALLLDMAENQLSKEDKNVQKELDDFRTSMLVYRYEKLFVEQRLDTLITEEECIQYYNENKQSFVSPVSVIKCRYIKISLNSPNHQIIKSLYRTLDPQQIAKLDDLCLSSADIYTDFSEGWIPLTTISKELDMDISLCENELTRENYIEKNNLNYSFLVRVYEKVAPGATTPFNYNLETIKESILSKRKQELISNLERNLLEDALNNNKLIIYSEYNDD